MKKILFFSLISALAVFTSCNKDEDEAEKFSELSVEENKTHVEDAGIQMVNTMDDMKDLQFMEVAINYADLVSTSDPMSSQTSKKATKVNSTMVVFAGLSTGEYNLEDLFLTIKSPGELNEDPETIQDIWDEIVGTYSWNPTAEDWNYTAGGDEVVFEFPATETSATNNAVLTITEYTGVVMPNPIDEEYTGDLPASLKANLKVDDVELLSYVYSATFNDEGIPSMIASDLTIETFSFEFDLTNTDTEVSVNYKITNNGETFLDMGGAMNGLFTEENIEDSKYIRYDTYTDYRWNSQTQQYEPVEVTDEYEEIEFEEVINSANAHFRIFNIEMRGNIDVKGLVDEMRVIYPDDEPDDFDDTAADEQAIEEINKYLDLRVINLDRNEKIAEVEAYVVYETEYSWIDFKLVFGDESTVDMETYFNDGFDDLVAEMNTMINELNSEYDLGLDEIEY